MEAHQSISDYFRERIILHNAAQGEMAKIKARHAPMYIAEMRYMRVGDSIHGLVKTDGDQFQCTRWYEFLNVAFGFIETMGVADKVAQISEFRSHMRVLAGEAVLNFDVPRIRTPLSKRVRDERGEAGDPTGAPVSQQLCLSGAGGSYRPVETRVDGGGTKLFHQTVLVGAPQSKQSFTSDGAAALVSRPVTAASVNLFAPNPDAVAKLFEFLTGKIYKPSHAFAVIPGERKQEEFKRKRKTLNVAPPVMRAIARFLPPFVTTSQALTELLDKTPACQVVDMTELSQYFQHYSWAGCFTLFMAPFPIDFTYGVGPEAERRACFLELWRRALKLEGALAKMSSYLETLFECVIATSTHSRTQMPPRFSTVPTKVIGNVRTLLLAGAGLQGSGKSFWHVDESTLEYLKVLPECGDPKITERINWLKSSREAAFEVFYPNVDELSLLPTLALVFSLREQLSRLDDESSRHRVLETMKLSSGSRAKIYHSYCLGWLIKYGGELTR